MGQAYIPPPPALLMAFYDALRDDDVLTYATICKSPYSGTERFVLKNTDGSVLFDIELGILEAMVTLERRRNS